MFLFRVFTAKQMPLPLSSTDYKNACLIFIRMTHCAGAASRVDVISAKQKRLSFRPASPTRHDPIPPRARPCNRVPFMLIGNPSAFNQLRRRHCFGALRELFLALVPRACFVTSRRGGKQSRTRPSPHRRHPGSLFIARRRREKKKGCAPEGGWIRVARGEPVWKKRKTRGEARKA